MQSVLNRLSVFSVTLFFIVAPAVLSSASQKQLELSVSCPDWYEFQLDLATGREWNQTWPRVGDVSLTTQLGSDGATELSVASDFWTHTINLYSGEMITQNGNSVNCQVNELSIVGVNWLERKIEYLVIHGDGQLGEATNAASTANSVGEPDQAPKQSQYRAGLWSSNNREKFVEDFNKVTVLNNLTLGLDNLEYELRSSGLGRDTREQVESRKDWFALILEWLRQAADMGAKVTMYPESENSVVAIKHRYISQGNIQTTGFPISHRDSKSQIFQKFVDKGMGGTDEIILAVVLEMGFNDVECIIHTETTSTPKDTVYCISQYIDDEERTVYSLKLNFDDKSLPPNILDGDLVSVSGVHSFLDNPIWSVSERGIPLKAGSVSVSLVQEYAGKTISDGTTPLSRDLPTSRRDEVGYLENSTSYRTLIYKP